MAYSRLYVFRAFNGREADVARETTSMLEYLSGQPGFIAGWILESTAEPGLVVRATLWETREAADKGANSQQTLASLSRIRMYGEEASIGSGVFSTTVVLPGGVHRE